MAWTQKILIQYSLPPMMTSLEFPLMGPFLSHWPLLQGRSRIWVTRRQHCYKNGPQEYAAKSNDIARANLVYSWSKHQTFSFKFSVFECLYLETFSKMKYYGKNSTVVARRKVALAETVGYRTHREAPIGDVWTLNVTLCERLINSTLTRALLTGMLFYSQGKIIVTY